MSKSRSISLHGLKKQSSQLPKLSRDYQYMADIIANSIKLDVIAEMTKIEKLEKRYKGSRYSKNDVLTNDAIINTFPNALLIEESIFDNNTDCNNEKKETKSVEEPIKTENIWDILNQLKDAKSDALDTLSTDSESDEKSPIQTKSSKSIKSIKSTKLTEPHSLDEKICCGCNSVGTFIENQHSSLLVCSECGLVNEELIDQGPEWRQYNNDDGKGEGISRCGGPTNFFFPKSSQGTVITGTSNRRLKRKQKWNMAVYKERSLNKVLESITQICTKHMIPTIIIDDAKIYYKQISDCKHKTGANIGKQIIIRGDNRINIIAACVYKACKKNQKPRDTKEVAAMFEIESKEITKGIKQFDNIIGNSDNSLVFEQIKESDITEDYIRRHCPKLKISKEETNVAVRIAQNCCRMKLASDHNPQSIAAGSILIMIDYCNLDIDKKYVSKLFGTSDVTISKIQKKIRPYTEALVDNDATDYLIAKFKING